MIAGEKDQRVGAKTSTLNCGQNLADAPVDLGDGIAREAEPRFAEKTR